MINYRIDSRNGIIVSRFSEVVDYQELIQWYQALERDEHFSNRLNGVTDMRGARVALEREDMEKIFRYVIDRRLTLGRWALLIEEPKITALSMIYERYVGDFHESEIFSSEEGASEYLGIDVVALLSGLPGASS